MALKVIHIYDSTLPQPNYPLLNGKNDFWYPLTSEFVLNKDEVKNMVFVKENCHSADFLRYFLKFANPSKRFITHTFFMEHKAIPRKSFFLTDGALNIEPTLDQRAKSIELILEFIRKNPTICQNDTEWVNFLTHSGDFDLRNKVSCDAQLLCAYFKDIQKYRYEYCFTNYQYDSCFYPESREAKGIKNAPDLYNISIPTVLSVPNIDTGNAIYKALFPFYNGYGYLLGGDVIGILNSRSCLDLNRESILKLEHKVD